MTHYAERWEERIGVPESFRPLDPDHDPGRLPGGVAWGPYIDALRDHLDAMAGSLPPHESLELLTRELERWTRRLRSHQVPERDQAFGHRVDLVGRGQVMAPPFELLERTRDRIAGKVRFGRFYLGGNGAVHGGALACFFDEVLGRMCDTDGRPPARTAGLEVSFRAVTPVDKDLDVVAWFEDEVGRKRTLRAEIRDGDVLCAEGRGLFLSLLAGQG